jgi:hypothetical protein
MKHAVDLVPIHDQEFLGWVFALKEKDGPKRNKVIGVATASDGSMHRAAILS